LAHTGSSKPVIESAHNEKRPKRRASGSLNSDLLAGQCGAIATAPFLQSHSAA
jgi:hypothetical protein